MGLLLRPRLIYLVPTIALHDPIFGSRVWDRGSVLGTWGIVLNELLWLGFPCVIFFISFFHSKFSLEPSKSQAFFLLKVLPLPRMSLYL